MEALGEADEQERRRRAGELQRDDAVELPLPEADDPEREEAGEERERGDRERVQAGSSELRFGTRSCSSTTPRSSSTSTT